MEQLALPFENYFEAKAKRLFKELETFRLSFYPNKWWTLCWEDFFAILLKGDDIIIFSQNDHITWKVITKED